MIQRTLAIVLAIAGTTMFSLVDRTLFGAETEIRLATFSADVTPPIGHPLMGGGIIAAQRIEDPLFARGIVLVGSGQPVVLVGIDWCEIRNEAYDRWREALAEAAGTSPARVLVASLHQHDAPVADLEAERILRAHRLEGSICDPVFHEQAVLRVAAAVRKGLEDLRPVTHLGLGKAQVLEVASNRRYRDSDGQLQFDRTSSTTNAAAQAADEGLIDPWLRTISFWNGDQAIAAVHCYATHPMSYYGKGGVNSDFVGHARRRRQQDDAKIHQVYLSGCSGNVTAGKYNDGAPLNRAVLAERIYDAMKSAWKDTERSPLGTWSFRATSLRLEPRTTPGFTAADLEAQLTSQSKPFTQCLAALGLSWRKRAEAGHTLDVPVIDFGAAKLILLPAEAYVEYQLLCQQVDPETFVMAVGYGECAPGYIPIERAWQEGDKNLGTWCWIAPGAESAMNTAIREVLVNKQAPSDNSQ